MDWLHIFDNSFLVACVTGLIALIPVLISLYKTKRLRYFELYFEKKVNLYEELVCDILKLLHAIDKDFGILNTSDYYKLRDKVNDSQFKVFLYCSKEVKDNMMIFSKLLYKFDSAPTHDNLLEIANHVFKCIDSMKEDIIKCRKGKFE